MALGLGIGLSKVNKGSSFNPVAEPPVNVIRPVISPSGNQVIGTLFTAGNGSWFGTRPFTFEYQWTRDGIAIGGETNRTYTSVSADEGKTLRCEVRATNAFGVSPFVPSSNSATGVSLPVNTVAPVISGSTTLGSVLTTTNGTWTGTAPITFSYQWKRGGVSIGGATASTYTLVAADSSANITCEVTGTNVAGSVAANSNTITASNFNPVNTIAPTLSPSGTQSTGTVITLGNGTWSGASPITFEYRWTRNNIVISGQTSNTYTIVAGDDGTVIKGQVRATNSLSTSAYVTTSNQVDANNVLNTARTQAFITATGITDQTIIDALNTMDTSLISAGLLPVGTGAGKIKALYPIVGGTAATHKFNFVDPRDLDAAFRLTFFGGWTHSANGMLSNGSNAYANTFFNALSVLSTTYAHQGFYNRLDSTSLVINGCESTNRFDFGFDVGRIPFHAIANTASSVGSSIGSTNNFILSRRTGTTAGKMERNGTVIVNALPTFSSYPNLTYFIGARNANGSPQLYGANDYAFYTLGETLNDTEASNYNTLVQAFQTTLGRAV